MRHTKCQAPYQASWGNKSHLHLRAGASVQGFIVDFYCHRAGLVIEVDGDVHDLQKEEDERREKVLSPSLRFGNAARSALGLRVVRLQNEEVLRNLAIVVGQIKEWIAK